MPSRSLLIALVATVALVSVVAPVQAGASGPDVATSSSIPDPRPESRTSVTNESMDIEVLSGPKVDWRTLDGKRAIRDALAAGRLNRTSTVAVNDPLVLAIEHEGVSDSLAGGNATERFFAHVAGNDTSLRIDQTNPTPERKPKIIRLTRNATSVVADPANDTAYVVVDTRSVPVYFGDPGDSDGNVRTELWREERFEANLTLHGSSNLTTGDRSVAAEVPFSIRTRTARISADDALADLTYVDTAADQQIDGSTNVRAGRNVTLVVRWNDPDRASDTIRRSVAVQADEEGENRFSATFDFSDAARNARASVDVRFDGRSLLGSNATLIVTAPDANVSVRAVKPDATGSYIRVETDANLSRGGFVVLHRGNATGPVVGVSEYLSRGEHENIWVNVGYPISESGRLVVVAHRDPSHNRWFDGPEGDPPYATNGSATARTDYVLTPQESVEVTPTPTPTTNNPETAATTTSPATPITATTATTATDVPGSTSQPGFGAFESLAALTVLLGWITLQRDRHS